MHHSIASVGRAAMLLLAMWPRLQAAEVAPAALPVLEETFLSDGSWSHAASLREKRLLALKAVAEIDHPSAVPTLLVAAGDWEPAVRAEAQRQLLESRGVTLADIRRQWLLSEDWFWRQGAIRTLLDHGVTADELVREVAALVENPSSDQRLAAVHALGQLESREGIASLRKVAADATADRALRLEAIGALHHLDGREVPLEAWTLALGDEGMRSLYGATLSGCHIAMRYLEAAGAEAVPVLCRALESPEPLVRMRAAWVLGRIGPAASAAAAALRKVADDPAWYVADEARRALTAIEPDEPPRPRSAPPAIDDSAPVTVADRGATLFLENGLVSCEVEKATGDLVSVRRGGDSRNLLGAKGRWYASFPWTLPRGSRRPQWADCTARIVRQSADLAEVSVVRHLDAPRPLTQEQRFVVRRGVSGVYQFAVYRKPEESQVPPGVVFDYARFMKADLNVFDSCAVGDSLQGELSTPDEMAAFKRRAQELSNATERLPNGRVRAKYSWCPYEQATNVHGVTGDGLGLWVIIPNDESGYNLPSNHPGSVHEAGDAAVIITHQEGVPHNVGSEQAVSIGAAPWEKLYGPVLLYVNTAANHAELWADAKRRAESEAAAHPPAWMEHDLYPLERATVRGRVIMPNGQPAAGAWVILCHPHPDPDRAWQRHKGPSIYRTYAAANGSFEIRGVRPGSYSLIARIDGVLGSARLDDLRLEAREDRDAGVLAIEDDRRGALVWQLGSPDGTPREFLGAVDSHEWCGWVNTYRRFFPSDIDFTIGKSDPQRDWYYCQPGGWFDGVSPRCEPTEWRIHFDMAAVPRGGAILAIGIAATRGGVLRIQCNDSELPPRRIDEADSRTALCMCPDRGAFYGFRTERFAIDASQLRVGRNTLRFRFASGTNPFEAIMYDMIRLEIP